MDHAILSPSTSKRWFNCPGSIRLSKGKRSKSGAAAIEGTRAHAIAEKILRTDKLKFPKDCSDDMKTAVKKYIKYIDDQINHFKEDPDYIIEKKVSLSHLGGDCWGTMDFGCWVIGDELYVIDYKHGVVTVEARQNTQLLIYILGLLEEIGYEFKYIYGVIVQPRASHEAGPIRSFRTTPAAMKSFKKELKQKIEDTKDPDATLCAGDWCQYCPAVGGCPEIVGHAQDLAKSEFANFTPTAVEEISNEHLAYILENKKALIAWLDAAEEEAVERFNSGKRLPEMKMIRTRGRIKWNEDKFWELTEEEGRLEVLTRTIPLTITEARGIVKKDEELSQALEQCIERPVGNLKVVTESDGRPEHQPAALEFEPWS